VMNYLTQMIPSTTIVDVQYIGKKQWLVLMELRINI
jgi:hypothetical protein